MILNPTVNSKKKALIDKLLFVINYLYILDYFVHNFLIVFIFSYLFIITLNKLI